MIKNKIPVQMAEKRMNIQKVAEATGLSRTTLSAMVNDKFTRIDLKTIEVLRRGRVRRAKLHYLRGLKGKAARIKELKRK